LRCSNIDQDFAKREKDVREGRRKGKKERRREERSQIHIPAHPPYVHCYFKRFKEIIIKKFMKKK
jgi:hypothetical protein